MSTVRLTQIRCDGFAILSARGASTDDGFFGRCSYWLEQDRQGSHTAAKEREKATKEGWTRSGTKDLCPSCTVELA